MPRRCGVVIVVAPSMDILRSVHPLLDHCEEQRISVLLLCADVEKAARAFDPGAVLCLPLDSEDREVALRLHTLLDRQQAVSRFNDELRLARRCQSGLEGEMTRIHDELRLAAMIQREHMPAKMPEVDDVRFGIFFRPSGFVSGDMFDVRILDEHRIGFFLADAVGHGVPAALLTVVISRSLQITQMRGTETVILPPAQVLSTLNDEMLRYQKAGGRFATALYGVIDTQSHEVTIAGAGHPPPLHIDANGSMREITTAGGLLGVFPEAFFDEVTVTLKQGDRLVCHTDGFETAYPDEATSDRPLPTNRCIDVFRNLALGDRPVAAMVDELTASIDDQRGSLHQDDDLTAIMIQTHAQKVAEPKTKQAASAA